MARLGPLLDPRLGNPGLVGTDCAFLAVVALLQGTELEPLLLMTAPQAIVGISAGTPGVVADLPAALARAEQLGTAFFVFRPGVVDPAYWPELVAWMHNLGCHQQVRTEALPRLRRWVLVSGAQLDHSATAAWREPLW